MTEKHKSDEGWDEIFFLRVNRFNIQNKWHILCPAKFHIRCSGRLFGLNGFWVISTPDVIVVSTVTMVAVLLLLGRFHICRGCSGGINHCVKSVSIRSFSGPNAGKYGKTQNTDTFYTVNINICRGHSGCKWSILLETYNVINR